ncbi:MAG: glycine--tRNA ligase subunit beta [Erythrobacter sp.]|nr:glycine--tRNA ligase subunit beta [Erythrobacter sp.]
MSDFLLELRSEEIPARMQAGARAELEKLFRREMDAAGVALGDITVWSTPRRLALIARDLPQSTDAVREEAKGPPEGAPDQAVDGFCHKNGVTREQLELREVKGRKTWFAVIEKPGRAVQDLLAEAIPAIIRDFAWPKSMRWGEASVSTESLRWVRPLSGIVALLGDDVIECEVHGVTSGSVTLGHRFHHSGDITIGNAADYAVKLRAGHVIVDHEERQDLIRTGAAKAAEDAGLKLVEDEGLVIENAGLTEWPVPLLGRFEEDFLEVPPETIQLTARVNQKYFVCETAEGKLANAFICTANIAAEDGGARVVDGNRKVLAARLADARFFWDVDRKKTLAQHAKGLERITFHEKLGTVADKVERVAKLARWLCEEGIVKGDPDKAEQAARLAKADLVTEMVGEFPELQGLMGGYYARAEGLDEEVADAISRQYKAEARRPLNPVYAALALADRIDTLNGFFSIGETPTGSKDPFALRRAAIDVLFLTGIVGPQFDLSRCCHNDVVEFIIERWVNQYKRNDARDDLLKAVLADRTNGRVRVMGAKFRALQSFMDTEDGANLLAGYKRAANILKKEDWRGIEGEIAQTGEEDPLALVDDPDMKAVIDAKMELAHAKELSYTPEPAEKALMAALENAEPRAAQAIESEEFTGAMAALASLREPIDRFFDEVTVNAEEKPKRAHRLDLLARFRAAVHRVADFSKIEG